MRLLDEVVDQLRRAVVHLNVERFHLVGEVVERHNGRDGDEQTEGGRDERFRDTTGDCADARGLLRGDLLEGVQNAGNGAQQADERCGGTDGCEAAETLLQLGVNDGLRALQGALRAFDLLCGDRATRTERTELGKTGGDNLSEVRLLGAVANLDRLIQTAFLQRAGNAWDANSCATACGLPRSTGSGRS